MPNEPRIQSRDVLLTCAEPAFREAQEASPRAVTIATMTTTTLVSTSITTAHTGYYAIPDDGLIRGIARQIKSVTGTTATVDQPWNVSTGVTSIRLWAPPDQPVVGTSAGSTTTVVASAHASLTNEPDDYWNSKGYFLLGRNSTFAGSCYQETDFTSSTGTFTASGGLGATPGVGALFDLRSLVRSEGQIEASINQKTLTRRIVGFQGADVAVPITTEGSVGFTTAVRSLAASAASVVAATGQLSARDLLGDIFTEYLDTGGNVTSVSTDLLQVNATITNGGFGLLNNGEAVQMLSGNGSAYNIPAGQMTASTVTSASVVYAAAWYRPKLTDFRTRTFDFYRSRLVRQLFHGCMPTMEINISRDQLVTFAWKYTAAASLEYEATNPITSTTAGLPLLDSSIPFDSKGARFLINGVKVLCGDMKINPGFTPIPRMSLSGMNQTDGMAMDVVPTTGSFTALADINDTASFKSLSDRIRSGDILALLYQKGTAPKNTFVIGMPTAQLTKCQHVYNGGQGEIQCEFVCLEAGVVPTGGAVASYDPSFAMGWL